MFEKSKKCYLYIDKHVEWPDANSDCERHGGNLAIVHSREIAEFLASVNRMGGWIGGRWHEGRWQWIDNTEWLWANWGAGQVNILNPGYLAKHS